MIKKFKCKKCGTGPLTRTELVAHYKEKHGGFAKKAERKAYTRKPKVVSLQDIAFCPRCGCNIRAVQAAMTL